MKFDKVSHRDSVFYLATQGFENAVLKIIVNHSSYLQNTCYVSSVVLSGSPYVD